MGAWDGEISIFGTKISPVVFFYRYLMSSKCQFFNFGEIQNETIQNESKTVAEGYEVGLIDVPANISWMEHTWLEPYDGEWGKQREEFNEKITSGYLFIKQPNGIFGAEIRCFDRSSPHNEWLKKAVDYSEYYVWDGMILILPPNAPAGGYDCKAAVNTYSAQIHPSNLFDPLMSMLGRLNADGIELKHCPAPAKLNRRREAKGLPGAVAYTTVKIRPPRAVMGHSGPIQGERLSPRYHFRRGHVRHFQNGEKTWVRPAFVGSPEMGGEIRHTYEVLDE